VKPDVGNPDLLVLIPRLWLGWWLSWVFLSCPLHASNPPRACWPATQKRNPSPIFSSTFTITVGQPPLNRLNLSVVPSIAFSFALAPPLFYLPGLELRSTIDLSCAT